MLCFILVELGFAEETGSARGKRGAWNFDPVDWGHARKHSTTDDECFIDAISLSLELHGEATASCVDSNAPLCRGNADYHTGLI
jgi:hypothetical protein